MPRNFALALWIGALLISSLAGAPPRAPAAGLTFTVNNVFDVPANFSNDPNFTVCHTAPSNNICTLRAAIMNANRHAGGAIILLPNQTYVLTLGPAGANDDASGDLNITGTVTLTGGGAAGTLVDGGGLDRVFRIDGGVVVMSGLTIRNGNSGAGPGGGIDNFGSLTLSDSTLSGNSATQGGGLHNELGASLLVRRSLIRNNQAVLNTGGGVENLGVLTLANSTVSANQARNGGGLSSHSPGSLTVVNSTISANSATHSAGGVYAVGPTDFYHTTIAGNLADSQGAQAGFGGGIYGSIAGQVHLWNSILAYNYVSSTVNVCQGAGITSDDYNFFDDTTGCTIAGSTGHDVSGSAVLLGELGDYGGSTPTRPLYASSPALDQIPPARCRDQFGAAPVPDQRGVARPVNGLCDMGAFEGALDLPFFFSNLIQNGDAEAAAGSPSGAFVGTPYWNGDVGTLTAVPYNSPGGFPAVGTDVVLANPGNNFFAGGSAANSLRYQTIPVSGIAAAIDEGGVHLTLSADLGGYMSQTDNAQVVVRFLDAVAGLIGSPVQVGPVGPGDRNNATGFVHVSTTVPVPAGARGLLVAVSMAGSTGYNDGYADNISLVLTPAHALFLPLARR
jgi:hypothetical protein